MPPLTQQVDLTGRMKSFFDPAVRACLLKVQWEPLPPHAASPDKERTKMSDILFGPPPSTLEVLLDDPGEHDFPAALRILRGLTGEQAVARSPGLPHSIGEIVAHMNANIQFNLSLIRAADPATHAGPGEHWPSVSAEGWPRLVDEFLLGLRTLQEIAREGTGLDRVLYPATEREPAWTVGYKLACSVAKHNAYHFGQIVVLRRLLGAWDEMAP